MSTVLWLNRLDDGVVTSEEADRPALYKHLSKLDGLCATCGVSSLTAMCDHTDIRFNTTDEPLPPGMSSTDEVMAHSGVWVDAASAIHTLEALLRHVREARTRFGILRNDHEAVVRELSEALIFLRRAEADGARVNFAVVM